MATTTPGVEVVMNGQSPTPRSYSTSELLGMPGREFIILAGKDGSGKTAAIISLAWFVQYVLNPEATFFVVDTENKFPTGLRSFGPGAPTNIQYFKCAKMNDVTDATDVILEQRKPGDWIAAESMGRIWSIAQDMGYMACSGYDKATYLEKRREIAKKAKKADVPVVIPKADDFWNIVKGAHDGAFLDAINNANSLNVILSTTIAKPPKEGGFIKENKDRAAFRAESGLDVGIDGAPRLPYYAETLCLLSMVNGVGQCRIVRDSPNPGEVTRKEFAVEGKKAFGTTFWDNCRG